MKSIQSNPQIDHLNKLELLLPEASNNLSKLMIAAFHQRIGNVSKLKSPLPKSFQVNGLVVIRNYDFDTILSAVNHIIDNMVRGRHYEQIKSSISNIMDYINHSDKHAIATQRGKLLLLRIIKDFRPSAHYNNLKQVINITVHLISECAVLNKEAFEDYHLLMQRFRKTHLK